MSRAPEEEIGYLLKRLMHLFRHELEARLRAADALPFAHLVTLDQIGAEPGITGAELARRLMVTAQTMTVLLRRLEAQGDIERRPHPSNRRVDCWHLLPAGQQHLASSRSNSAPVMTQMLSGLPPDDVARLRGYLESCVASLEQGGTPPTARCP